MSAFIQKYWTYFLVLVVGFAQYSNTFKHDYAWDDVIVITQNTRVQKGLSNIPELFENIKTGKTEHHYGYRPIALLSFATDVELFGMDPSASHVVNAFLYALLCFIILVFLNGIFPNEGVKMFLVTLLFAVHPLHTEVVANIKSRDEILAMLFGISGLMAYYQYIKRSGIWLLLLSVFLFVLAFLSKENAITLCGLAVLMPFILKEGSMRRSLTLSMVAVLFALVLLAIRAFVYSQFFYQDNGAELVEKGIYHWDGFLGNPLFDVTDKWQLLANSVYLLGHYLYQFFWPYTLVHDYGYNHLPVVQLSDYRVWLSVLAILGLVMLALTYRAKRSPVLFGVVWFFVTISIYLHLVRPATDIYAERYLFVPSLGLSLMFVGGVYDLTARLRRKQLVGAGICLLAILWFSWSWKRNYAWKDNITLFKTDLPYLKDCVRTNYNYALLLHGEFYGLPEERKKAASEEIISYYKAAYDLTDRLFNVYMDLGSAYMEFGYPEKGKEVFMHAIEKFPEISVPYVQMAKYHMTFQRFAEAIPFLEQARENGAANSDFYYLLAICQFNSGLQSRAMETLYEGEKLGVSSSAYYDLMARFHVALGEDDRAKEALRKGLSQFKNDPGLQQRLDKLNKVN